MSNYRDHRNQNDVDDPQWDHTSKVHDWRNYIGSRTRTLWHTFTPEQRMAIAADADVLAGKEVWD